MIEQALYTDTLFEYCPDYDPVEYPGIRSMWVEGMEMDGRRTKFFAVVGFPEGADKDTPVPAVVLVHGGGGVAYPCWVDMWNRRGYAAIAMCNTGYIPTSEVMKNWENVSLWTHTLPDEMYARDPRILTPDNDGMYTSTESLDNMWMYHAVTQTILCHNILRADARVDAARIGITGISWGGVITSITIGYDSRFAFAVPVYGSGYLHESLSWMKKNFNAPGAYELWDASHRLKDVKMPVLWVAWTNDPSFSINTHDKSFADTENGILALLMDVGHSHPEGWNPQEIYRFADSVVKSGEPLPTCKTQPSGRGSISFAVHLPADTVAATARVCYLTERMTYSEDSHIEQTWTMTSATVTGDTVSALIPPDAWSYYVEIAATVTGGQTYVTTSRYITLKI